MVFMSTADEPRPIEPLTLTSAAEWRRLEFSSTSVWSGARPRSAAGRTVSVPSFSAGRGKLKEGRATASAWFTSVTPPFSSASAPTTSTATAVSSAVRSATRVPVTMMTLSSLGADCAAAWANSRGVAATPARMADFRVLNFIVGLSMPPVPWAVLLKRPRLRREADGCNGNNGFHPYREHVACTCDANATQAPSAECSATRVRGERNTKGGGLLRRPYASLHLRVSV